MLFYGVLWFLCYLSFKKLEMSFFFVIEHFFGLKFVFDVQILDKSFMLNMVHE